MYVERVILGFDSNTERSPRDVVHQELCEPPGVGECDNVHIIDHEVLSDTNQLRVRRMARVRYNLPSIVHYIVGPNIEYMLLEDSVLDPEGREISVRTTGFTMTDTYRYEEDSTFTGLKDDRTRYNSVIDFRILGFGVFNSTLESVTSRVVSEFSRDNAVEKALLDAASKLE